MKISYYHPRPDKKLRWETNDVNQDELLDEENKLIYESTILFFEDQYHIIKWEDYDLWLGHVELHHPCSDFFQKYATDLIELKEMCLSILRDTLNSTHKHLNS